ncbi:hypothetical protein GCM10009854_49680 [Saccharopolyspora halophila]|uniref:Uncharacterized protein n=1 Tax=Saccharopolyspora halophila TaxID=405551 RepID=A0ABP5U0A7_9PSEU
MSALNALAHHQSNPLCTTSSPKAMPNGNIAKPTELESFNAPRNSARLPSSGSATGAGSSDEAVTYAIIVFEQGNMVAFNC